MSIIGNNVELPMTERMVFVHQLIHACTLEERDRVAAYEDASEKRESCSMSQH